MEARLFQKLLINKSEARVIALVAAVTTAVASASTRRLLIDEEDKITGEVPSKVLSISLRFKGLCSEKIMRIF